MATAKMTTSENKAAVPYTPEKEIIMPGAKVGTFIVINTAQTKGQRYNLEKVRTYGKNEDTIIALVWDNGISSQLQFGSKAEADEVLAQLDSYCL